jgi:hypothetical protein
LVWPCRGSNPRFAALEVSFWLLDMYVVLYVSFTVVSLSCVSLRFFWMNTDHSVMLFKHLFNFQWIYNNLTDWYEIMMRSALYKTNMLSWVFIVLAHWNNSPQIDISPYSYTLSWFRANQSRSFSLMLFDSKIIHFLMFLWVISLTEGKMVPVPCMWQKDKECWA